MEEKIPPFAMPMYHDWVPKPVRPWIYVVLAFCFQFSGGIYLGAMNNMIGAMVLLVTAISPFNSRPAVSSSRCIQREYAIYQN